MALHIKGFPTTRLLMPKASNVTPIELHSEVKLNFKTHTSRAITVT